MLAECESHLLSRNVNLKVCRQGCIFICRNGFQSFHTYASVSYVLDADLGREDMHRGMSLYPRALQEPNALSLQTAMGVGAGASAVRELGNLGQ